VVAEELQALTRSSIHIRGVIIFLANERELLSEESEANIWLIPLNSLAMTNNREGDMVPTICTLPPEQRGAHAG